MFGPLVLDLFADESNAKCEAFYSAVDNALSQDWSSRLVELNGAAFANPPYSRASQHDGQYITGMRHIMAYAAEMRERGGRYVFLIKAATSEVWWPEMADHILFIRGRVGFDVPVWFKPSDEQQVPTGAFFAGAIAVFDKTWRGPAMGYVSRDQLEAQGNAFLAQIRREAQRINQQQNIPEIIPARGVGGMIKGPLISSQRYLDLAKVIDKAYRFRVFAVVVYPVILRGRQYTMIMDGHHNYGRRPAGRC